MKKLFNILSKISVAAIALVLVNVANSSSCFYIHQPKEPKAIEDFKWIK